VKRCGPPRRRARSASAVFRIFVHGVCLSLRDAGNRRWANFAGTNLLSLDQVLLGQYLFYRQGRPLERYRQGGRSNVDCGPVVAAVLIERNGETNTEGAIKWLRLAADQNDKNAQYYLGLLTLLNTPGPDFKAAAVWFQRAASHGQADAQRELGMFFLRGMEF
jgi:TPR repeat protein